jgi:alkanesulfonate monooxygenase SsuD/methylene tetrahydromethanopterin reductase-like flavin-dependent oxidoreductase (luciferase family)
MDVGIGLPTAVPGVRRAGVVDWARRAEAAGFSSLGVLDRIVYPNFEPLAALAAAAAVTERVRLMTDILIAPLRSNTALFAKQAGTIDRLSEGRLVLGLAVGGRPDDFEASGVEFARRGRLFDAQLAELETLWAPDGRPDMLIGGTSDAAFRRAARFADGWTMGGGGVEAFTGGLAKLQAAWAAAGRSGEPRTAALGYFSLGPDAEAVARASLGDYYAFAGPYAESVIAGALKDPAAIRESLAAFAEAGCEEVVLFPASADLGQIELLAAAAL